MKRIHISEAQLNEISEERNQAGTDYPHYKNGDFEIRGNYCTEEACPFGYFYNPLTNESEFRLASSDSYDYDGMENITHRDVLDNFTESCIYSTIRNEFEDKDDVFCEEMTNFFKKVIPEDYQKEYGSRMGDSLINVDGKTITFVEALQNIFDICSIGVLSNEKLASAVFDIFQDNNFEILGGFYMDLEEYIADYLNDGDAYGIGLMFGIDEDEILRKSSLEGRIWTETRLITFYPGQQPSRDEMRMVISDISKDLRISEEELYKFYTIFEVGSSTPYDYSNGGYSAHEDATVQCCTVAEYIAGKYSGFNRDKEAEMVKNRKGVEQLNVHLANQDVKREYFKNFRDTRDKAVYAPREKAAGTLAAYHAMRYPYGENKERNIDMKKIIKLTEGDLHRIVKEAVSKILESEDAWSKYPAEDQNEAMLDMNMNDRTSGDFANAYAREDPMVKSIQGTTLRDMLKARMGNDIDDEDEEKKLIRQWLNSPKNVQKKLFPRGKSKPRNYDSLANGSARIQAYKRKKGL